MADRKITDLTELSTLADDDVFAIVDISTGITKKVRLSTIQTAVGVEVETPVGTVNGVNAAFTVTAVPKWIVSDSVIYFDGQGYSIAGLNITMDIPPSIYIRAVL